VAIEVFVRHVSGAYSSGSVQDFHLIPFSVFASEPFEANGTIIRRKDMVSSKIRRRFTAESYQQDYKGVMQFLLPASLFVGFFPEKEKNSGQIKKSSGEFKTNSGEFKTNSGEFKTNSGEFKTNSEEFKTHSGEFKKNSGELKTISSEFFCVCRAKT
jgi:hypothetical protein